MIHKLEDLIADKISGEWGTEGTPENGVKVIRTANFTNEGVINYDNLVYRKIDSRKVDSKRLQKGDIIIEKSGGSPKQPVGRVVFFDLKTDEPFLCNNFTSILRPNKNLVYPKYLFYRLFEGHKEGRTLKYQNKTTGIINLKLENYLQEKLDIPDTLEDQIHIANILSKAEALIAQRKESLRLLDEFLMSTFLKMFVKTKRNNKVPLDDLIDIQSGQVDPRVEPFNTMLHVGGANIESNTGKLINVKRAIDENLVSGKYLFKKGTVLYSKIRPNLNKVAIPTFDGICSADIYPLLPRKELINPYTLRYILMSQDFLSHTRRYSERTNIPKVNRDSLLRYKVLLPPIELQTQFAHIVEKTEALKVHYQTSLQELENLYGSLSQRAFKGELNLKGEEPDSYRVSMAAEPRAKYSNIK